MCDNMTENNVPIANCKGCKHSYDADIERVNIIDYDRCDISNIMFDLVFINNEVHCPHFDGCNMLPCKEQHYCDSNNMNVLTKNVCDKNEIGISQE